LRPFDQANIKGTRQGNYTYRPGTTKILSEQVKPIVNVKLGTEVDVAQPMDQDVAL